MSKYTRKFTAKLEGQEEAILFSSLTAAQVDEFLIEQADSMAETDKDKRQARLEKNTYHLLANVLNNAATNGDATWTIERVKAEFDKEQLDVILEEAMKRSGLAYPKAEAPATSLPLTS